MEKYRVALLREEFPFIDQLRFGNDELSPADADSISIKRGDHALMARKGRCDEWRSVSLHTTDYTIFYAVKGEEIFQLRYEGESETAGGKRYVYDCDTIAEQLFEMNFDPDWIVEAVHNDVDINGGQELFRWTIYKMNKFDLLAYHKEQVDRAATKIKAELELVCSASV